MNILDWILPARHDEQVFELAQRIAQQQRERVWTLLEHRRGSLASIPEAQGYIRFRALTLLECNLPAGNDPAQRLSPALRARVIDYAAELLVAEFVGPMVRPTRAVGRLRQAA